MAWFTGIRSGASFGDYDLGDRLAELEMVAGRDGDALDGRVNMGDILCVLLLVIF